MKAIKNLIITLVVIVAILGVGVIGGYIYVRTTYGIDLFRTAGQLKTLSKDVDESALCPNAYGEQDFAEMKSAVNDKIDGLIVYEKGKGYNGYSVNFASLAGKSMTDPIFLTEKHVGAIAQTVFYEKTGGLMTGLAAANGGNSTTVYQMSIGLLGPVGGVLAMIGVIVCPITSGDTAFRSARLVLADWFKIDQNQIQKRLVLCVPLLAAGAFIGHLDYAIVWRYFSWTNQTLAMIVLWTASMYLYREQKNYWITAVPATFMSAVSMTYFVCASECLGLSTTIAYPAGIILAALFLGIFIHATKKPVKAA